MKQNIPVILINSLNVIRGGVTKAVFTRANTLAEKFNKVYIFTFLYQQNHNQIISRLYKTGLLNEKVIVFNLFEDLKPSKIKEQKVKHKVKEKELIEFQDVKQDNPSYRYYRDGLYVKYKRFNQDGNLLFIDYMNESRHRLAREEYNSLGYLARKRHMDQTLNNPRLERYFDNQGKCYLTIWVNPKTKKESRVVYFGKESREYNSIDGLKKLWLEQKLEEISNPILMIDNRHMDKLVLGLSNEDIKKVAVIHNNHLKKPFNVHSEVENKFLNVFNNLSSFEKVVYLTEEQKVDVEKQFGTSNNNFVVISHPAEQVNQSIEKEFRTSYDPHLAVSLARYVSQKRLDEAIRAFCFVVDKIPSAKYHIYGYGNERDKLNQLIKELKLEDNVKLKGFTTDASYRYKEAACSILTSDFEGFGMVLTESLASGTPAVSYDTKYGPKDIIRNGVDGYIVGKGDRKGLAEKIVNIMENKDLRERLSYNALEVNKRFSVEKYTNDWNNLLLNI